VDIKGQFLYRDIYRTSNGLGLVTPDQGSAIEDAIKPGIADPCCLRNVNLPQSSLYEVKL